jgi:hypothetical protein
MKKNNINLSIALNRVIEPLLREKYKYCRIEKKQDVLLYLKDSYDESDFYLGIIREQIEANSHVIQYSCKPASSQNIKAATQNVTLEGFNNEFKAWLSNLEYYHGDSILNDPILTGYRNEFYDDFKIVDDDADYVSFNYGQQLLLDRFLENVINNIDEVETPRNKEIIYEIINDSTILREQITTETKNGFISKLSQIFAKARKGGLKITAFLFKELGKEIISESAKSIFSFAMNNSGEIIKYLHK